MLKELLASLTVLKSNASYPLALTALTSHFCLSVVPPVEFNLIKLSEETKFKLPLDPLPAPLIVTVPAKVAFCDELSVRAVVVPVANLSYLQH